MPFPLPKKLPPLTHVRQGMAGFALSEEIAVRFPLPLPDGSYDLTRLAGKTVERFLAFGGGERSYAKVGNILAPIRRLAPTGLKTLPVPLRETHQAPGLRLPASSLEAMARLLRQSRHDTPYTHVAAFLPGGRVVATDGFVLLIADGAHAFKFDYPVYLGHEGLKLLKGATQIGYALDEEQKLEHLAVKAGSFTYLITPWDLQYPKYESVPAQLDHPDTLPVPGNPPLYGVEFWEDLAKAGYTKVFLTEDPPHAIRDEGDAETVLELPAPLGLDPDLPLALTVEYVLLAKRFVGTGHQARMLPRPKGDHLFEFSSPDGRLRAYLHALRVR